METLRTVSCWVTIIMRHQFSSELHKWTHFCSKCMMHASHEAASLDLPDLVKMMAGKVWVSALTSKCHPQISNDWPLWPLNAPEHYNKKNSGLELSLFRKLKCLLDVRFKFTRGSERLGKTGHEEGIASLTWLLLTSGNTDLFNYVLRPECD